MMNQGPPVDEAIAKGKKAGFRRRSSKSALEQVLWMPRKHHSNGTESLPWNEKNYTGLASF